MVFVTCEVCESSFRVRVIDSPARAPVHQCRCFTRNRMLNAIDEWRRGAFASPGQPADGINYGNRCAAETLKIRHDLITHLRACDLCKANGSDKSIPALEAEIANTRLL